MKVNIQAYYTTVNSTEVELPEGKTWDDVSNYWIKWGILYITWSDGQNQEINLSSEFETGDTKFPDSYWVFTEDMNELIDERG